MLGSRCVAFPFVVYLLRSLYTCVLLLLRKQPFELCLHVVVVVLADVRTYYRTFPSLSFRRTFALELAYAEIYKPHIYRRTNARIKQICDDYRGTSLFLFLANLVLAGVCSAF